MALYWPRDRGYEPKEDFSRERARREAGISARSAAPAASVDLFGEVRATLPPEARKRPTQARRPSQRPPAGPEEQEQLQGTVLPFSDPIHARCLARSTPPIINGPRARIEAEVDEAFQGVGMGGTLAQVVPADLVGDLTVIHLIECRIDLYRGPVLLQTRPRPDDHEVETTAAFWNLLAEANIGDRVEIDDNVVCIFARGCAVWWDGIQTLFWFTLNRDLLQLCQSYFRDRNDVLQAMVRAELAEEMIRDFSLRLEDPKEWFRRVAEQEAAQAVRGRFIERFGHHPLYPPHYL